MALAGGEAEGGADSPSGAGSFNAKGGDSSVSALRSAASAIQRIGAAASTSSVTCLHMQAFQRSCRPNAQGMRLSWRHGTTRACAQALLSVGARPRSSLTG